MKTSTKSRTLQWIKAQYTKGNLSFKHKLQRPTGQWSPKMKSLLIHSLLSGYPINPIYIAEENNTMYTLDGSQRTWTCIDYLVGGFALSKDTPNIKITYKENGESIEKEYKIAGKKFKKLDEEVQNTLLASELSFCTISDYTDDEVREMFRRQNSSKPLSGKLLRVVYESDEFSEAVYSLSRHSFMYKLITPAQRKNGTDRDIIIQTMMLILTDQNNDYTSFRSKDIDVFVMDHSEECLDKTETLKTAMDSFNAAFDDIKITVTSIPMVLYCGYRMKKDKKSFTKLVNIINNFLSGYDTNEEYKQYVLSGTSSSDNVSGRLNYWKGFVKAM